MAAPVDPFALPFTEAEAYFKAKLNIPSERWTDLWHGEHSKGFMSAGAYQADLLSDIRHAADKAVAGNLTKDAFRNEFAAIVERHGWQHHGSRNWRSDVIWDTNISTAYQAGRWQQFVESGVTLLEYRHADGVINPRPEHVAWDGLVLPLNDPWWLTHYPPNGWKCHCRAVAADGMTVGVAPEEEAYQWINKHTGEVHTIPEGIDPGWAYNVGAEADQPYTVLAAKFEQLPNDIARVAIKDAVQGPAFARFVAGQINSNFPVAVLSLADMGVLGTQAQTVWMSHETLLAHLAKHPEIGLADYARIPEIVDTGEVYRQGEARLIYLQKGEKLYRAALKKTEDGAENYFLTLFEIKDPAKALRQVAKFEKVR